MTSFSLAIECDLKTNTGVQAHRYTILGSKAVNFDSNVLKILECIKIIMKLTVNQEEANDNMSKITCNALPGTIIANLCQDFSLKKLRF